MSSEKICEYDSSLCYKVFEDSISWICPRCSRSYEAKVEDTLINTIHIRKTSSHLLKQMSEVSSNLANVRFDVICPNCQGRDNVLPPSGIMDENGKITLVCSCGHIWPYE